MNSGAAILRAAISFSGIANILKFIIQLLNHRIEFGMAYLIFNVIGANVLSAVVFAALE